VYLGDAVFHDFLTNRPDLLPTSSLFTPLMHNCWSLATIAWHLWKHLHEIRSLGRLFKMSWSKLRTIIGHVVNNNNSMSASIVRRGDGVESFLTYWKGQKSDWRRVCSRKTYLLYLTRNITQSIWSTTIHTCHWRRLTDNHTNSFMTWCLRLDDS
jgi:hypothetical protein